MAAGSTAGSSNAAILPMYDKTPLSHLLEAAVQKTYHELYVMSDVLLNKKDIERKEELVKFACRTRQLFIRILAVVKWAATAGKVNACEDIQHFLERRVRLLRETSDSLAQLAREKLLDARLPNFPITDAVDILTMGSVSFLPERISEATSPFVPATETERHEILPRLQQILMARVAIAELPIQFTSVAIKNGIVTLAVDGEFEVKLGVTSDNLFAPWHVYKTKLFLRDPEEPEQELVHATQMQTLTNYIQSGLIESENPLVELYRYLHYYCQSLRLQILFEQAHRIRNRSVKQKHLHLSSYVPCKSFNIEYWKESHLTNPTSHVQKKPMTNEKSRDIGMTIVCDDDGKFQIVHWPPLPVEDSVAILQISEKTTFTMEEILNRTIHARCQRRFEELKDTILSTTSANIDIDLSIPALKCELLPESTSEEALFVSISPFSGLYKVVSYMETRHCQQIEHALNRDQGSLIEAINAFKIWLIQQRIPSLLAHLNCRVYTRLPSLNPKHELIAPFLNNSFYIELLNNEGYYILVHISDPNQLLLQYYLLIVEKRSSPHDPLIIQQQQQQQQNLGYNQPMPQSMMGSNEEYAKWIIEPLVLCALDPTAFLRRESIKFKNPLQSAKPRESMDDEMGTKHMRTTSVLSLKLLLKLVNYYDEMLTFTFLKEELQRKKTICTGIMYSPWTGIPFLDIVRTSAGDDAFSSNTELSSYVQECFWPRILSCTIRLAYTLRDTSYAHRYTERQWTLELKLLDNNYFHNSLIKTPYHSTIVCTHLPAKVYTKVVDYIHGELRATFELTHLFENYALALPESMDLQAVAEVSSFNFFKSTLHYGPNFAFTVILTYRSNAMQPDPSANIGGTFDLRFTTVNSKFLSTAHQILNGRLIQFLNRTRSLKQFLRLLHMTTIPIASIARLNCFNRPMILINQGACNQFTVTFVPYTEARWRLIFGQYFALDIQICGPNLILIRDGAFSVQLNSPLTELMPIPRLKEFLSKYADDRGLTYEFTHITDRFRDRDFILPELQLPSEQSPISTIPTHPSTLNRTLTTGNAPTPHLLHPIGTPASSMNPLTPASVGPGSQSQQQAPSPSQSLFSPNPNFICTGSPMTAATTTNMPSSQLPAPSPMGTMTASPGDMCDITYMNPASRQSGSTFPGSFVGPSPGTPATNTATSVPTPSNARSDDTSNKQSTGFHSYNRHLFTKPHYPVYMSQQTFFRMLYSPDGHQWSKLESFIASSVLVKHFAQAVTDSNNPNNSNICAVSNESDTYRIAHLSLQLAYLFDSSSATYRIHLSSPLDTSSPQQSNSVWSSDELQIMDAFFNESFFPQAPSSNASNPITMPSLDILSLGATQHRTTAMGTFERMLSYIQPRVLRDLIKIIRLEQNHENNYNWRARWCLTIPQGNGFTQVGHSAIYYQPNGIFIFTFQFIPRTNRNDPQMTGSANTSSAFVVPLTYDMNTNHTALFDRLSKQTLMAGDMRYQNIIKILMNSRETTSQYDCSLFASIVELLTHLPTPSHSNYPS